ncbi:DNA damage-inducible transcript 4-like protein [Microcaecilia unicolor]|uniref:DNA damage-inducible transcript 4-like protein n=1 Tax=Microcaecilia unicolor TaxID=1415580 RepID=A0A6P7X4P8_9AMPH|nr:DNA damage-inducible transcript 4-like protein [Microcaecilia unicolor]
MVATTTLNIKNSECFSTLVDPGLHSAGISELLYWDPVSLNLNLKEAVTEEKSCHSLIKMLENCLSRSKQTKLKCSKVLVPEKLIRRIAQEIVHLSSTEPCGLRGCVIFVNLEVDSTCKKLDKIVYDSSVVPTFELTLVLKQEGHSWPGLRNFFIGACFTSVFHRVLKLSPSFWLLKRKLYSAVTAETQPKECFSL